MARSEKTNSAVHMKKAMIAALEKSLGIVTTACKTTGISRTTFYAWYDNDEEFRKEVGDMQEIALDFAESNLHMLIKNGNPAATIFYLKTKGRARGYIERQDVNIVESSAFVFQGQDKGIKKILNVAHKKKAS